jgi:hypothetical protein
LDGVLNKTYTACDFSLKATRQQIINSSKALEAGSTHNPIYAF